MAIALVNRGELARLEGRDNDALSQNARSLELSRPTGDRFLITVALVNSANLYLKRGDTAPARAMLVEALGLYRGLWDEWGAAYCLVAFGGLAVAEGDARRGATLLAATETWFRRMGLEIEATDREAFDRYVAAAPARRGLVRAGVEDGAGAVAGQSGLPRRIPLGRSSLCGWLRRGDDPAVTRWTVDRIVRFDFRSNDIVRSGQVHFGFHDRRGHHYGIAHEKHFLGLIGEGDGLAWTVAAEPVFPNVPNIAARLEFPMYVDSLPDDTLVVSNFQTAELYAVDVAAMTARLLVDGHAIGMRDMGNCVVDDEGYVWVNEVAGCRVWRFDPTGRPVLTIGDGTPGFQREPVDLAGARFSWIYDIRRAPDGQVYVLDSRNYALRAIDPAARCVRTVAGTGRPGYDGDGGDAREATLGGDPSAKFDGPISLSLDDDGNAYIGDRFNHVVRMIDRAGRIATIAGHPDVGHDQANDPMERDPLRLSLPQISSMDHHAGQLFVPTDLTPDSGDLAVLRRIRTPGPASC